MASLCCGLPIKEDPAPLIVDVMKVISDVAWNDFRCHLGYFRRKLINRSNYIIDVPENYFAFDQKGKTQFEPVDKLLSNCLGNIKAISTSNLHRENTQQSPPPPKKVSNNGDALVVPGGEGDNVKGTDGDGDDERPDQAVSLDTTFSNGTGENQTYQFKFSKVRTSKLEVSYHRGFTVSGKASFSIGLPKTVVSGSLGLAAERTLEVKKSHGQTYEESITMEATSEIHVAPNSKYVAKVQLEERSIHSNFTVRIRMSMPQGQAPVYIRQKSDNAQVYFLNITNLEHIFFGDFGSFPSARKVGDDDEDGGGGDVVDFLVEGVVKGSLACDHTIDLSSDEKDKSTAKK